MELRRELQALEDRNANSSAGSGTVMLHLSDAEIDHLCTRYRASALAEDEVARIKGLSAVQMEVDVDVLEMALPDMRRAFAAGDLSPVYPSLRQFLKSIGMIVPRQSPSYDRLALGISRLSWRFTRRCCSAGAKTLWLTESRRQVRRWRRHRNPQHRLLRQIRLLSFP